MSIWASIRPLAQIEGATSGDEPEVSLDQIPGRDEDGTPDPRESSYSFDVATSWYPTVRFCIWNTQDDVYVILTPEEARELAGRLLLAAKVADSERDDLGDDR
jgi:hypothetical protein